MTSKGCLDVRSAGARTRRFRATRARRCDQRAKSACAVSTCCDVVRVRVRVGSAVCFVCWVRCVASEFSPLCLVCVVCCFPCCGAWGPSCASCAVSCVVGGVGVRVHRCVRCACQRACACMCGGACGVRCVCRVLGPWGLFCVGSMVSFMCAVSCSALRGTGFVVCRVRACVRVLYPLSHSSVGSVVFSCVVLSFVPRGRTLSHTR